MLYAAIMRWFTIHLLGSVFGLNKRNVVPLQHDPPQWLAGVLLHVHLTGLVQNQIHVLVKSWKVTFGHKLLNQSAEFFLRIRIRIVLIRPPPQNKSRSRFLDFTVYDLRILANIFLNSLIKKYKELYSDLFEVFQHKYKLKYLKY